MAGLQQNVSVVAVAGSGIAGRKEPLGSGMWEGGFGSVALASCLLNVAVL